MRCALLYVVNTLLDDSRDAVVPLHRDAAIPDHVPAVTISQPQHLMFLQFSLSSLSVTEKAESAHIPAHLFR